MKYFFLIICLLIIIMVSFSCSPKREVADDSITNGALEFVKDRETVKQEIIDQLGPATYSYENGRIIIYYWVGMESIYHLVFIFSEENVLERHSVVRVR